MESSEESERLRRAKELRDKCQEDGIIFHRIITETIPRIEGEIKDLQGRYTLLSDTMSGLVMSSAEVSRRLEVIDLKLTPLVDFRAKYIAISSKIGTLSVIILLIYAGSSEGLDLIKLITKALT